MNIFLSESEQTYIEKATINADDDLDIPNGGTAMKPEQAKEFFIRVRNQMRLNNHAQIVPMTGNGIEIPRMNISGRVLERDEFTTSTRRAISTDTVSMTGKRIKAAYNVTQGFIDQNVEQDRVLNTLVDAFSRKFANGAEELLWQANTLGPAVVQSEFNNDRDNVGSTSDVVLDRLYNLFDGIIKQAVDGGNIVNGANSEDLRYLVTQAKKALPSQYRDDIDMLRIYMPLDIEENLRYILGERRTPLGDLALNSTGAVTIGGIQVVGLPLLSNRPKYVQNVTFTGTAAQGLDFAYVDQDEFIVAPTTLSTSAVTPNVLTTDYTVQETAGTITRVGAGGISDGAIKKVTYNIPPLFILTPWPNMVVGLNQDFRVGQFYDVDTDTTLFVIRSRIDFLFQEAEAVVLVKNVQDALPTTAPL